MLFILHAEADKLCLKDLSSDLTKDLDQRLRADNSAMEKFYQFFGLNLGHQFELNTLKNLFPDTTVSVLKKCFEALLLYDLSEILEKVRPRSLRPVVSPEQIEKLRRADDRPTKYHSDVAVLVVDYAFKRDIVKGEAVKKIETFFKDLNSRNKVAVISLASSQETQEVLRKIKKRHRGIDSDYGDFTRENLELILQEKARLEKQLESVMQMAHWGKQAQSQLLRRLSKLKEQEVKWRGNVENVAKEENQAERDFEKLRELEKEIEKSVSMAMEEWVHNQGWLTS